MTEQQAQQLEVGDRVKWVRDKPTNCWSGTVEKIVPIQRGLIIRWDDGQIGGIDYRDMLHVEREG